MSNAFLLLKSKSMNLVDSLKHSWADAHVDQPLTHHISNHQLDSPPGDLLFSQLRFSHPLEGPICTICFQDILRLAWDSQV